MGDHRADIKITMSAHGKTYKQEWWINWSPNDDGCDQRIVDWFRECWEDAYRRAEAEVAKMMSAERAKQTEKYEREQLATLKAKYELPEDES